MQVLVFKSLIGKMSLVKHNRSSKMLAMSPKISIFFGPKASIVLLIKNYKEAAA